MSLRGEIAYSLDLNECCDHLKALRICHNHDWISKRRHNHSNENSRSKPAESGRHMPTISISESFQTIKLNLPNSLQYLCLYKCSFDASILNESFHTSCKRLIHIALIECKWTNGTLSLPQSLISLHLKANQGKPSELFLLFSFLLLHFYVSLVGF